MDLIKFKVKVSSIQKIPGAGLSQDQILDLGNLAIKEQIKRVQTKHTGIFDEPMPAYSDKPIYVKLSRDRGKAVLKSGNITLKSLASLRRAGVRIIDTRHAGPKLRRAQAKVKNAVRITGESVKFPNRTAYKRYLGKSGLRDLTDTGQMLAALVIVSRTGNQYVKVISIGFTDPVQEKKAAGNMRWADWFGLSPSNEIKIAAAAEKMVAKNLKSASV